MATLKGGADHFNGGANLNSGHGAQDEHLGTLWNDGISDVTDLLQGLQDIVDKIDTEIVASLQALADKLDADAGVTDVDYRTVLDATLVGGYRTALDAVIAELRNTLS